MNRKQGLGFVLAGTVIDLRTLKKGFSAIVSGFLTLYALLLGLLGESSDELSTSGADVPALGQCAVSAEMSATIRAAVLLSGGNATTCSYNVTLDAVLAGGW